MKTIDISGMGGHYELTCQMLLWTGIRYLAKIDNQDEIFKGTHGHHLKAIKDTSFFGFNIKKNDEVIIHGILETPESCREMEKEMSEAVKGDWTGMQHETVMGHLQKIAENGYDWWIDQFKDEPKRIYEIDVEKILGDRNE